MDPVIGLDVAKGESQVQAFLREKHRKKFNVSTKETLKSNTSILINMKCGDLSSSILPN